MGMYNVIARHISAALSTSSMLYIWTAIAGDGVLTGGGGGGGDSGCDGY